MARIARAVGLGLLHHIIQRGNRRQPTFSGGSPLRLTVPLYEFTDKAGVRSYSTSDAAAPGLRRSEAPVCRVWPSPSRFDPWKVADPAAKTARGSGI